MDNGGLSVVNTPHSNANGDPSIAESIFLTDIIDFPIFLMYMTIKDLVVESIWSGRTYTICYIILVQREPIGFIDDIMVN